MMIEPSVEQADQCAIVQQDFAELINRLLDEGIDRRIIMAGLSAAASGAVMTFYGPAEVPVWFAKQSVLTTHFTASLK